MFLQCPCTGLQCGLAPQFGDQGCGVFVVCNQVIGPDHQRSGVPSCGSGDFKHPVSRRRVYRHLGPLHQFIEAHVVLVPDVHIQRIQFISLLVV